MRDGREYCFHSPIARFHCNPQISFQIPQAFFPPLAQQLHCPGDLGVSGEGKSRGLAYAEGLPHPARASQHILSFSTWLPRRVAA